MSNKKKRDKYLLNAELKWQKEQLQIGAAAETLSKAVAVVEQYKDELTVEQLDEVMRKFYFQSEEIRHAAEKAKAKYIAKLKELGDPKINPETGELV